MWSKCFRLLNVKDIVDRLHCNVCLIEYRGYGHSDGTPSEEGIYMDAQAAIDYLTKTYQRNNMIDPRKVLRMSQICPILNLSIFLQLRI